MIPNRQTFQACARGGRSFLTAAALCLLLPSLAASASPAATVTVREQGGIYTVAAEFVVEQPQSVVWSVLTDYEQIPRFIPGVHTSVLRNRTTGRALVEQEAVASVMVFAKTVHLVLEIDERPDSLTFHDRCGRSFVKYDGAWRFYPKEGLTTIAYELVAKPTFDVPSFMLKRLLRRDSAEMIANIRREIVTRANASATLVP